VKTRRLHGLALVDGALQRATLTIRGRRLEEVARCERPSGGAEPISGLILPGFVDLHVHGGAGADFMDASPEAVRAVTTFHARHGTVALAATTLSAPSSEVDAAIRAVATAHRNGRAGARLVGIHLEGPYLNPSRCGAHDPSALRPPDAEELASWLGEAGDLPVMMTLAPELPGALDLISAFRRQAIFALGHSEASFEQASEALAHGARHATHLFNAMAPLHHRCPGLPGAVFASSSATAELIADGVHLHPAVVALAARALPGRAVLVTDAMRACGMPEGVFSLHRHRVTVFEGAARLADGTLAGSMLTMARALRNAVQQAGLPLEQAAEMASGTPARILGLTRSGRIAPGCDADLVVLREGSLELERVILSGEELDL
jgi:N-acetylglucosamine-6-phosphate deacetylase